MTMPPKNNCLLEAIHETAHDFYDSGAFNQEQMQKYDALCLSPVSTEVAKILIYLDNDIIEYLNEKCLIKQESLQALVNDLLRKDIEIAKRVAL